jgi:Family of unknown function (DUF5995)
MATTSSGPDRSSPSTLPEVIACLDAIQAQAVEVDNRGEHDGLACFNYLYRRITEEVLREVEAGMFQDNTFLVALDVEFARRYLHAIALYGVDPRSAPRSWQVLLDARSNPHIAPMQFAVTGVNAHVNFDLPFALVAACEAIGSPLGSDTQRQDYQRINQIFAGQMAALRHHFEDADERAIDREAVSTVNNDVDDLAVVLSRDAAWHRAKHLWSVRNEPSVIHTETEAMDHLVSLAGRGLLIHL